MNAIVRAEFTRLLATGVAVGGSDDRGRVRRRTWVGALALIGPENAQPAMPGLDSAEGVAVALDLVNVSLFLAAVVGTVAVTSEYRHHPIAATLPGGAETVPRSRGQTHRLFGSGRGIWGGAVGGRGGGTVRRRVRGGDVGRGARRIHCRASAPAHRRRRGLHGDRGRRRCVVRNQLVEVGLLVGYFYFLEVVLMIVPGVNAFYPYLPGGASAVLVQFDYLSDAVGEQASLPTADLLAPVSGGVVLAGYAVAAAATPVLDLLGLHERADGVVDEVLCPAGDHRGDTDDGLVESGSGHGKVRNFGRRGQVVLGEPLDIGTGENLVGDLVPDRRLDGRILTEGCHSAHVTIGVEDLAPGEVGGDRRDRENATSISGIVTAIQRSPFRGGWETRSVGTPAATPTACVRSVDTSSRSRRSPARSANVERIGACGSVHRAERRRDLGGSHRESRN